MSNADGAIPFIAIGENIHCSRVVKREGIRGGIAPDGRPGVRFPDGDGGEAWVPLPDSIVESKEFTQSERIKHVMGNRQLILGVDRLDYTKGIPERLAAFERLLKRSREARARYALIQVMVPSRTDVKAYADLKEDIDRMVGDINGRFADTGRVPVHYLYRNLSQRALFAHYRAADVALVTPLRDGMNLIAKEYAATRLNNTGALVLSEFTGSARELKNAIIINPHDIDGLSASIYKAIHMSEGETTRRMRGLRQTIRANDVYHWANSFLEALTR